MRKILFMYFVLLLIYPMAICGKNQKELHVVSYNIWDGFEGDSIRRAGFVDFMKRESPDIVALEELVGFTEKDLLALAGTYGHPYAAIVKEGGYPVGITSKYPVEIMTRQVEGFWHGMMHVRIAGVDCIVTHLSPADRGIRLEEANKIVSYIRKQGLEDYLLMGDMNAYSPLDADEYAGKNLLLLRMQNDDKKQKTYRNLHDGRFDYSVLSVFLSAEMEDAIGRLVHPASARITFPAAFLYGWEWGDERLKPIGERLDYIFVSPSLMKKCVKAGVYNGAELEGISDHYPVGINLVM